MKEFILICNCYEPMFREDIKVKAKASRKYKAKKNDINITWVDVYLLSKVVEDFPHMLSEIAENTLKF